MPAPDSYDMGKKAIAVVRRGEAKKTWARCGWTLAATPWTGGWNERRKLGTIGQSPTINREVSTKSWTGRDLVSFPESMEVTRKQKGLSLWGDKVTQQNLSDALAKIRWSRKKASVPFRGSLEMQGTLNTDLRGSRRRWTQAPSLSTAIEEQISGADGVGGWSRDWLSGGIPLWLLRKGATLPCPSIR